MLEIKNLKKTFDGGSEALRGVNLKVNKGEFISILGPSGSGKTTLLRSINGLEKIDNGNIFFEEEKIKKAVLEAHNHGQIGGYGGKMSHYMEVKDSDYNVLREVIKLLNKS